MSKGTARDPIYRGRRFHAEIIEQCARWYITYRLSYRELAAMMAERGVTVSHATVLRWVSRYVPEFERRWARFARPVGLSWRVDETAIAVRGGRSARKVRGLTSLCPSGDRVGAGVFQASRRHAGAPMTAQGEARWQRREPPGAAAAGPGGTAVAVGPGATTTDSTGNTRRFLWAFIHTSR